MKKSYDDLKKEAWVTALSKLLDSNPFDATTLVINNSLSDEVLQDSGIRGRVMMIFVSLVSDSDRKSITYYGGMSKIKFASALVKEFKVPQEMVTSCLINQILSCAAETGKLMPNFVEIVNTFDLPVDVFSDESLRKAALKDIKRNNGRDKVSRYLTLLRCFELNSELREKLIYKIINACLDEEREYYELDRLNFHKTPKKEILRVAQKIYLDRLTKGQWELVSGFPVIYSFTEDFLHSDEMRVVIYLGLLKRNGPRKNNPAYAKFSQELAKVQSPNPDDPESLIRNLCLKYGDFEGARLLEAYFKIPKDKMKTILSDFLSKLINENWEWYFILTQEYDFPYKELLPYEEKVAIKLLKKGKPRSARDLILDMDRFAKLMKTSEATEAAKIGFIKALNRADFEEIMFFINMDKYI